MGNNFDGLWQATLPQALMSIGVHSTAGQVLQSVIRPCPFRFRTHLPIFAVARIVFLRQLNHHLTHIELTGDDVGDQAGAVFLK